VLIAVCNSLGACGSRASCCGSCNGSQPAVIHFSCVTPLENVAVTGPCSSPFAGDAGEAASADQAVFVNGEQAGACHVVLRFLTGGTYAVDVTFGTETSYACGSPACGSCGQITVPTSGPFTVPSSTCAVDTAE
jgi:hypothetical protein